MMFAMTSMVRVSGPSSSPPFAEGDGAAAADVEVSVCGGASGPDGTSGASADAAAGASAVSAGGAAALLPPHANAERRTTAVAPERLTRAHAFMRRIVHQPASAPLWTFGPGSRGQKRLPLGERRPRAERDVCRRAPARFGRPLPERHARFLRRVLPLLQIAGATRDDEVLPHVASASRARENVIHVELAHARLRSAVLALIAVAEQ